jgi:hypothetical protein
MGGDFTGHHDVAETLADAGFIVAAIDHPGHTTFDMSSGDLSVFVERPTDIKRLIDFMLGAPPAAPKIDPKRIGFFGFSAGGYTGLVLIGANPDWAIPLCRRSSAAPICGQILGKEFRVQPLAHDPRIKAAVIADPFSLFFTGDSFAAVKVPVQLWASERGTELGGRCLRLKPLPPWTEACRLSTSIMWCRTPRISPSYSFARPHWRRTGPSSARMRRASIASPSTSSSMRPSWRSFGITYRRGEAQT